MRSHLNFGFFFTLTKNKTTQLTQQLHSESFSVRNDSMYSTFCSLSTFPITYNSSLPTIRSVCPDTILCLYYFVLSASKRQDIIVLEIIHPADRRGQSWAGFSNLWISDLNFQNPRADFQDPLNTYLFETTFWLRFSICTSIVMGNILYLLWRYYVSLYH